MKTNVNDLINLRFEILNNSCVVVKNNIQYYKCGISYYGDVNNDPESSFFLRKTITELLEILIDIRNH